MFLKSRAERGNPIIIGISLKQTLKIDLFLSVVCKRVAIPHAQDARIRNFEKKQVARSPAVFIPLSFLKRHVHQKLVALNVHYIAEGSLAAPREVEPYAAAAYPHVANT